MMTFKEWIATQDQNLWQLDEASINAITQHFMFREIVDDVRMPVYFWRTLAKFRERYKQLLRVQSIEFDPIVNRYFEAEYTTQSQRKNNGTQETIETGSNTVTSTGTDTTKGTSKNDRHLTETGGDVTDTKHDETVDGNTIENTVFTGSKQDTGTSGNNRTDTKTGGQTEKTIELDFQGRYDELSKNGSIKDTTTFPVKKITNDGGIHDHGDNTNDFETSEYSNAAGYNRQASKQAPMSATGIGTNGSVTMNMSHDGESFDSDTVSGLISLPGDTFEYASKVDQADDVQHNNSKNKRSESLHVDINHDDDRSTTETYEGTQTVDHNFQNYKERNDKHGKEIQKEKYTLNTPETVTSYENGTHSSTETTRDQTDRTITDHRTTAGTDKQTVSRTNEAIEAAESQDNVDATHNRQDNGKTSSNQNVTSNASENVESVNRNRYTGREGLTAQAGMREAEDYLLGYSPAFQFLIDKLEINFIGVYDL